ncbi:hypothetical protein E2C01_086105 [Portunus trituberculatus]|uniref:Uncharacterized protein n=1 Tax=Portunus trituberculatus TaxID=210409 RepID=A0A5B7J2X3_PORTR|nr:hypothetical protein [Portunus trituberculatus]
MSVPCGKEQFFFMHKAIIMLHNAVLVSVRLCYRPLPALGCPVCYACLVVAKTLHHAHLVVAKTLHQLFNLVTLLNKRGIHD